MTKDEYEDFVLRYKGCGACFPMYHTLSRFEKMWFSAIQKDVTELEKENARLTTNEKSLLAERKIIAKENAELKEIVDNDVDKKIYVQLAKKAELADVQKDQLTKAKEIIKDLLSFVDSLGNYSGGIFAKAEQFLREVENV